MDKPKRKRFRYPAMDRPVQCVQEVVGCHGQHGREKVWQETCGEENVMKNDMIIEEELLDSILRSLNEIALTDCRPYHIFEPLSNRLSDGYAEDYFQCIKCKGVISKTPHKWWLRGKEMVKRDPAELPNTDDRLRSDIT